MTGNDYVLLSDIAVFAHHGALPSENDLGQRFYFTVRVELDAREAARSDQVRATVNYAEIFEIVQHLQGPRGEPLSRGNPDWRSRDAVDHPERVEMIYPVGDKKAAPHLMRRGPFQLIETLGHEAALAILARFPVAQAVEVTVRKPSVPIQGVVGHAEIRIRRERHDLDTSPF
jgi:dihydroneopterin aldolase